MASRLQDQLLAKNIQPARFGKSPMVDLTYSGQNGWDLDVNGWVGTTHQVRKPLVALLVEPPRGFDFYPQDKPKLISMLRSMIELHPLSIDGLTQGLEVAVSEQAIGGAGQKFHDPTNVTEAQSEVTFRYAERYGYAFSRYLSCYIKNLIMDPYTKYPGWTNLPNAKSLSEDQLADVYSFSVLYYEPDSTNKFVNRAWLMANQYFKTSGEITGKRDLTAEGEVPTYDVPLAGFQLTGLGVDEFAQRIMDAMNTTGADPIGRKAFLDKISADVLAAKKGYDPNIRDLAATAVRPL